MSQKADFSLTSVQITREQQDRGNTQSLEAALLPCRLLCNRLEVLVHLALLRGTFAGRFKGEKTVSQSVTETNSYRWSVSKVRL